MEETGVDKQTAIRFLIKCGWSYDYAIDLYRLPEKLKNAQKVVTQNIDYRSIMVQMCEAIDEACRCVSEMLRQIDWQKIGELVVKKLEEGEQNGKNE
jgi:hypothetical protein